MTELGNEGGISPIPEDPHNPLNGGGIARIFRIFSQPETSAIYTILAEQAEPITLGHIGSLYGGSRARFSSAREVSLNISHLERERLIERVQTPDNKVGFRVTPFGSRIYAAIYPAAVAVHEIVRADIDDRRANS